MVDNSSSSHGAFELQRIANGQDENRSVSKSPLASKARLFLANLELASHPRAAAVVRAERTNWVEANVVQETSILLEAYEWIVMHG